jgi:hypothetical protein
MGFLRRLLGGPPGERDASDADRGRTAAGDWTDEDERAHELELARFEQDRTSDLVRRQQRYGDRAWTPPPQGGSKRAGEDEETDAPG